jgi:hypothetical protein
MSYVDGGYTCTAETPAVGSDKKMPAKDAKKAQTALEGLARLQGLEATVSTPRH